MPFLSVVGLGDIGHTSMAYHAIRSDSHGVELAVTPEQAINATVEGEEQVIAAMRCFRITLVDYIAAKAGVWAMKRLYSSGCAPPYQDGCVGCDAGRMAERLEELAADLRRDLAL